MTSTRVQGGAVAAVVLAVLAATAPVTSATDAAELAAVSDQLVVGGTHSDFGTGEEADPAALENFSVSGSGDSASISGPVGGLTKGGGVVSDGGSISWTEADPATSDSVLNVTGVTNTEWGNVSSSSVGDGETINVPVGGNVQPDGGTEGSEPVVTFTGTPDYSHSTSGETHTTIDIAEDGTDVTFYANSNDGVYVEIDGNIEYSGSSGTGTAEYTHTLSAGTHNIDIYPHDGGSISESGWDGGLKTEDPSLTFDTGETVSYSGALTEGETYSEAVDLSSSTSSADVALNASNQAVDVQIEMRERTQTVDAGIELNGDSSQQINISGSLSDGETVLKEIDNSWLEDSNTATVSLNNESLSADAPPMEASVEVEKPAQRATYVSANYTKSQYGFNRSDAVAIDWSGSGPLDVTIQRWTGSAWEDARQLSTPTTGNVTLDYAAVTAEKVRTKIVAQGDAVIDDESILFTNHAPEAANIEPPDDKKLRDDDTAQFNVSVVDPEFSTAQGDTVTAELVYDGSVVHSESVSSNTTVSTTHQIVDGGAHTWYWRLSDSYGAVTETEQRTVEAPAVLEIRDEQNASQLISTQTEVTVTFFGREGEIVTKTTTNGTVDLTGLPINRRFTVRADAQNYTSRRTILESLYQQQSVFLIDENATTVTVEFQLEDDTGIFPAADSELLIQRALDPNGDGNSSYVTVSADQFGATGSYSATLVKDERYRLIVRNDDGDRRSLGTYIPRESRVQPLPVGRVEFSTNVENGIRFDASIETTGSDRYLRVYYQDIDNQTERVTFNATYRNGTSISQQTFNGPLGSSVATFDLPDNSTSDGIRVQYEADTTAGGTEAGRILLGGVDGFADQFGIDQRLRILTGVAAILAVTGLTVIAFPSAAALVAVGTASVLHLIGWMTTSPLALGLAGFVALAYTFGDRS